MRVVSEGIWHVHFAGGQKVKWALDEDLRWAREALGERARFTSLPASRIVHAAWWPTLLAAGLGSFEGKQVICFADNPPALYLSQPGFTEAASRVDLWIARSREALGQFQSLGLNAVLAPYCVDPEVFRPMSDRAALRRECGLPEEAFVVGNFHRDSEGSDLGSPKAQKGPDIFFQIASELHRREPRTVVLLAGPRRHWLRRELKKAGVPYRFVGVVSEEDDYEINILDRVRLNRLYQTLDVCVISSRWEGGPYSALEGLFAGRPVVSTPVGVARDVLPEEFLFHSVEEAVERLMVIAARPISAIRLEELRESAVSRHSVSALRQSLLRAYEKLPVGAVGLAGLVRSGKNHIISGLMQRYGRASLQRPQVIRGNAPAKMLPVETPLAPIVDREVLLRSAADIAWFRAG